MKIEFKIVESRRNLLTSLIFLVIGSLIFAYPNAVISIASKIIGIVLILYSLFLIVKNYYDTKNDSTTPSTTLVIAIIILILGILFVVLSDSISQIVQYIIGAWILFNGIERFIIALNMGTKNDRFITQLVIAIILLAGGLYTIFKANLPIQIIGLIIIIYSILSIIGYITNKQEVKKEETVTEKIENKVKEKEQEEDIKEAKILETKEDNEEEKTKGKKKKKK